MTNDTYIKLDKFVVAQLCKLYEIIKLKNINDCHYYQIKNNTQGISDLFIYCDTVSRKIIKISFTTPKKAYKLELFCRDYTERRLYSSLDSYTDLQQYSLLLLGHNLYDITTIDQIQCILQDSYFNHLKEIRGVTKNV